MLIRCYAVGRDGEWEAICLDFCLSAQGNSFDDVRKKLAESIEGYLEYVNTLPAGERRAFLRRRAPLGQRLEFYSIMLRSMFGRGRNDGGKDGHAMRIPVISYA